MSPHLWKALARLLVAVGAAAGPSRGRCQVSQSSSAIATAFLCSSGILVPSHCVHSSWRLAPVLVSSQWRCLRGLVWGLAAAIPVALRSSRPVARVPVVRGRASSRAQDSIRQGLRRPGPSPGPCLWSRSGSTLLCCALSSRLRLPDPRPGAGVQQRLPAAQGAEGTLHWCFGLLRAGVVVPRNLWATGLQVSMSLSGKRS